MSRLKADDPIEVRIQLPLPTDIAATLIQIVGTTWRRTQIADDGHNGLRPRELVLVIDPKDRFKTAKGKKKYEKAKRHLSEEDLIIPWLTELGPNGASVSPHEFLVKWWVDLARRSFELMDAPNYLETEVWDTDTRQNYIFHVARGSKDGSTPHGLRMAAEKKLEEAQARITELEALLKEKERSAPRKRASSAKRSGTSSTATTSRGKAGTPKADQSSPPGTGRSRSPRKATKNSPPNPL